jgi:hypothetical protein
MISAKTGPESSVCPDSALSMTPTKLTGPAPVTVTPSVQEIDNLITELETLRDMLHSEGARVQREIVEYTSLITGALQSTKTITESLTQWKKVPSLTLS